MYIFKSNYKVNNSYASPTRRDPIIISITRLCNGWGVRQTINLWSEDYDLCLGEGRCPLPDLNIDLIRESDNECS